MIFLLLLVLLAGCSPAESDDCEAALKDCQEHLAQCRRNDATENIWLGDVPLYDNKDGR